MLKFRLTNVELILRNVGHCMTVENCAGASLLILPWRSDSFGQVIADLFFVRQSRIKVCGS